MIVRPQAVGICGSDFHFFLGEIDPTGSGSQFPRIQGHEVAAVVEEVGPDCERGLTGGDMVALHPLSHCGHCYPCRIGRHNVCDNFSLIGIHSDGGLQEQLVMPESLVVRHERAAAGRGRARRAAVHSRAHREPRAHRARRARGGAGRGTDRAGRGPARGGARRHRC